MAIINIIQDIDRMVGKQLVWPMVITGAIVLILNNLYRWPLYQYGIQIILKMQQTENILFDYFFLFITMIIDPTVVFAICILMMVLTRKKNNGFVMLVFILFNTFLAALFKAFDSDPRPFWTQNRIRNIGFYCPVEYGNPSGHSWFSAVFGFGILLNQRGPGPNFINIWISIAAVILMPISRMYLGAHSLNQVLEGLILGLIMCILYPIGLKGKIQEYLQKFNKVSHFRLLIAGFHILALIPFIAHRKQELPPEWQANVLEKCGKVMNEHKLNSLMLIVNAMLINIGTGIGIGYQKLYNSTMGKEYLEGKWQINQQKYQIKKGYCYFVFVEVALLLSGVLIGGILFLATGRGVAIGYLAMSLGGLASGYIYTTKSCQTLVKYRIIRQIQP